MSPTTSAGYFNRQLLGTPKLNEKWLSRTSKLCDILLLGTPKWIEILLPGTPKWSEISILEFANSIPWKFCKSKYKNKKKHNIHYKLNLCQNILKIKMFSIAPTAGNSQQYQGVFWGFLLSPVFPVHVKNRMLLAVYFITKRESLIFQETRRGRPH